MRTVAWNCATELPPKIDALMTLRHDVAMISEAAAPERLVTLAPELADASLVWVGRYLLVRRICGQPLGADVENISFFCPASAIVPNPSLEHRAGCSASYHRFLVSG